MLSSITYGQSAPDVIFGLWNIWRPIHGIPTSYII